MSVVGHEVDVSIADLVADSRAPTPSAAAEIVVPDRAVLQRLLVRDWDRLGRAVRSLVERSEGRLTRAREGVSRLSPAARLAARRARLDQLASSLARSLEARLAARRARLRALGGLLPRALGEGSGRRRARLAEAAARLEELSPLSVLARGYALVRRASDGALVRRAEQLSPGERVAVRVAEAEIDASVNAIRTLEG